MRRIIQVLIIIIFYSHVLAKDAIPERVVCLAPSYDETLIELGLRDKIVGVTTASDYLEEVKNVERVGFFIKPNVEKIVSLKPDLVIADDFVGQKAAVEKLKNLGIRVMVFEIEGVEDISVMVKRLGELLGVRKRSEELLLRMRQVVEETKARTKQLSEPRVYIEVGCDPLFTCGKGSFIHDLIEIAGGENIAGDINKPFPRVSSEFILSRDPEVIILPYMDRNFGKETLRKRNGWGRISAVKNGRIYDDIGSHVITISSPRLILYGLPELLKRIHPEIAKETTSPLTLPSPLRGEDEGEGEIKNQ